MGEDRRRQLCSLMAGALMAAAMLAACGSSNGTKPSLAPTASPALQSTTPAVASSSAAASPSSTATIGLPADDGARIVAVQTVNARTRDLTIDSPAVGVRYVRLLLPGRFDAAPSTRWPVLYLLHGADGSSLDWTSMTDVAELTRPTNLLVVMPDAGESGWYSDWWNDGKGGPPMWETFHVVELRQLLERNWRAGNKRVVAGLSMGGFGAMEYAGRHPGLFLAAASFSGVLQTVGSGLDVDPALWGDGTAQADVWNAHDPVNLAPGLKGVALFVSYGDGRAGPFDNGVVPDGDFEGWIADRNTPFLNKLKTLGIRATVDAYGAGTHSWPYWERGLHRSMPLLLKALGEHP